MTKTDPLIGAKERYIEACQQIATLAGEMLTCAQVAHLLSLAPHDVEQDRQAEKLIAVQINSDWLYPAFQFRADALLPGLETVLAAFAGHSHWSIIEQFLITDDAFGGRSLLDAINEGDKKTIRRMLSQVRGDGYG
jgi:hypothetical protein